MWGESTGHQTVIWSFDISALAITPSHQQNTDDFADGRKNMNYIFNIMFVMCPICVQDSIFKMSSESPDFLWS